MYFEYINEVTQELKDYRNERDLFTKDNQLERKILGHDEMSKLTEKTIGSNFKTMNISEISPIIPVEAFGDNRRISYMPFEGSKDNTGVAFVGDFRKGAFEADSLTMILGKQVFEEGEYRFQPLQTIKNVSGTQDFYKVGNTLHTSKSSIVAGANKDNQRMGSKVVSNSGYEITTIMRNLKSKGEKKGTKEFEIFQAMEKNDYSNLSNLPIYSATESWVTQGDKLTKGSLETAIYDTGQVTDATILKTKTRVGEKYVTNRFMNLDVFNKDTASMKRNSTKNRSDFFKFSEENRNIIGNGEDLVSKIVELEEMKINSLFSPITESYHKKYFEKSTDVKIKGKELLNNLNSAEDVLNKKESLVNNLRAIISKNEKIAVSDVDLKIIESYSFSSKHISSAIENVNKKYKKVEEIYKDELLKRMKSKVEESVNANKYDLIISKTKDEDFEATKGMLVGENVRKFYDKYNLKIEFLDILTERRKHTKISEMDIEAANVKIIRDKDNKILDIVSSPNQNRKQKKFYSDEEKELSWLYSKVKSKKGFKYVDSLSINEKLKLMETYKKQNKSLFDKHSKETSFSKYDSVDEFSKHQKESDYLVARESSTGTALSRTVDKIFSKINYKTNALEVNLNMFEKVEGGTENIKINLKFSDGFDKNDYIKGIQQDNQAVMKEMDIKAQKEIQSAMNMYKDNYELQNKIRNVLKTLNPEDHDYLQKNEKLKGYISILKGHRNNKERYFEMNEQGEFIKKGNSRIGNGRYEEKVAAKSYTDVYNKIVDELEDKYKIKGKKIKDGETGFSETDLMHNLLKKKMDNTVFNLIINGDDIVNTTGSAKQTGMIGGDSYMGHPGFGMSGLSFNKVTQRTYQAQDLLGEASLRIRNANGDKKLTTISEANSQLLKRMGTSGVGKRVAHYQTEQVVLDAIEHIRTNNNMSDMEYTRGQSYKTFAIGDVNTNIGKEGELNSFTASFQEGMTAAKSLQLTTNPIRNKSVILDLDKLDYDALGYSKKEVHDLLSTKETQHLIFEKIIDEKLYKTIEGKDKYSEFYDNLLEFSEKNNIGEDMDSLKKLHNYVNDQLGGKSKLGKIVDNEVGRMSVSSKIMNLLGTAEKNLGAISEAGGKFGKVKITNGEYVKDLLELKPEVGFRIGGIDYNSQTSSIEIALENIASVDQGSKQQTIGAKYTVSEVYDFLKLKSKNGEQFIDAVFNNKAERRKQTGMLIHGALQTVVTNVFEDLGEQGIKELNANMGELLKDLQVDVKLSKEFGVLIDETYLTKDLKGESITAEKFLELSKDPLENMSKIFTEKGKKIFEDVTKKYGYSYYTPDGKQAVGEMSHYGILTAMQKAYSKTYDKFGKEETAFIVNNASIEAFGKEGKVAIGNGPMLLLKLASERVNSNANKKKDGGLKLGTGISDMIRMSGYNELIDHIQTRNQEKVNNYLGSVFQNLSNSEIIKKIFVRNQDFDMDVLVGSVANSISNGVVFDLDKVKTTDYILNKTEEYLSHEKLMERSILGKSILKKGLDKIENDSLAESVNVVIKDSNIQEVSNLINKDFDIVEKYLRNHNLNKTINLDYVTHLSLENKSRTRSESAYLKSQTEKVVTGLKNTIHHMKKSGLDTKTQNSIGNVIGIMKLFSENADNVYGLKQLQTMIFMGKILTTLELNYDVSSTDGTIVPNESFNRIKNLAEKSLAYKNNKSSSADFIKNAFDEDGEFLDNSYTNLVNNFDGKGENTPEIYKKIISKLKTDDKNVANVIKTIEINSNLKELHRLEKVSANDFLQKNMNKIKASDFEMEKRMKAIDDKISERAKKIKDNDEKIYKFLSQEGIAKKIKSGIRDVVLNGATLSDNKTFEDLAKEEGGNTNKNSLNLLREYLRTPDEASKIHSKKGSLTKLQKFEIKSSFTANPIEGSNMMNKIENLMFDNVKTIDELKKNADELGDFLGFKLVNDKLFQSDGVSIIETLEGKTGNEFEEGMKKAKELFSKNLANTSEITITSKKYMGSFRDKEFEYKDMFTGKSINETGYSREMSFFARHPQQTINHFGGVQTIVLDTKNKNLNNKFARASLTFLSEEKNQAGVITLGKKTMLFRRGDQWSPHKEIYGKKYCERLTIGVLSA